MRLWAWLAGLFAGCSSLMLPDPAVPFKAIPFAEKPRIVQRQGEFFLSYRIAVTKGELRLKHVLVAKKTANKGYYYYGVPVSDEETGVQVNRPLAFDSFTEFATRNAVYWLDPDGTETHLRVVAESAKTDH